MLIEQDGPEWREKLPDIPLVPLSAQQHRREEPPSAEVLQARAEKAVRDAGLCCFGFFFYHKNVFYLIRSNTTQITHGVNWGEKYLCN